MTIFNTIDADHIYQAIDRRTGPEAWNSLRQLLATVAAGNVPLYLELESRLNVYVLQQTNAALHLGAELAPALTILTRE